jgi:hypothetical protein
VSSHGRIRKCAFRALAKSAVSLAALGFLLLTAGRGFAFFSNRIAVNRSSERAEFLRWECVRRTAIEMTARGLRYNISTPPGDIYLSQRAISTLVPSVVLDENAPRTIVIRLGPAVSSGRTCADLTIDVVVR